MKEITAVYKTFDDVAIEDLIKSILPKSNIDKRFVEIIVSASDNSTIVYQINLNPDNLEADITITKPRDKEGFNLIRFNYVNDHRSIIEIEKQINQKYDVEKL